MDFFKFDDWSTLEGLEVEIWRGGSLVRRCVIDAATKDSSIVWSAADANNHRRLWDKARGFEVRVPLVFIQRAEAQERMEGRPGNERCSQIQAGTGKNRFTH
ncbi:hypothetical protein [Arthrobacter sp. ISL-28]|uniref:hypothetical protein n=1 Tax=Arthrobacter sp. ISL-28 TaxID=2819108 RepID=UPI001BE915CC|nr:hypothetical protein [Arthrobacter sp. ISL-28]MBT2522617.1 hypothetical protein [Arthrobacter sp. ISL-28]